MNFITFNQDYSCLAVGTSRGFCVYLTEPFSKCFQSTEGNISILEMLFSTSLVALVLSPRRLQIKNTKRETTICELTFPSAVLSVRLNRKRLAVVLEEQIYLYDISNMNFLYTLETSPNPSAICALSPSSNTSSYLALPLPKRAPPSSSMAPRPSHTPNTNSLNSAYVPPTTGAVLLFDTIRLQTINVVEAHRSPLSCIAINPTGTLLATASDKGTIIRVFSLPQAEKLYQFRRGSIPATIYSMSFNLTSTLLCVSSATDTVHIFRLDNAPHSTDRGESSSIDTTTTSTIKPTSPSRGRPRSVSQTSSTLSSPSTTPPAATSPPRSHNGTLSSILRRSSQTIGKTFASSVSGYLPSAVTEMWEPARDFAYIKIPKSSTAGHPPTTSTSGLSAPPPPPGPSPIRSVVAMSSTKPEVMVVTSDGVFYVFAIDLSKGGEGVLLRKYSLTEESSRLGGSLGEE